MAVKQLWTTPPQFVDENGDPYSGAFLFFYTAGSSTKENVYTTSAGNVAASNPLTLNAEGYPETSGTIFSPWGTVGVSYKIGLAAPGSSDPPNSFIWTQDNVTPINDTTVTQDQWVAGPAPTYINATSFSLVGDQTSTFQVGRRVKTTNSGGTVYSEISASVFGAVTTVTVVNDSGTLDSGLSAVSYGLLSATNPSVPTTRTSYTATLSGCTTAPTGSVKVAKLGDIVIVDVPAFSATSNATSKTLTGMPAAYRPIASKNFIAIASDNGGANAAVLMTIGTDGVMTFYKNLDGGSPTNSGTWSTPEQSFVYAVP